jgi:S1-C subfamily serine protease
MSDETTYFLRDRNRVSGPFSLQQLQALKQRGRLARFHLVSPDRRNWMGADTIPGLFEPGGYDLVGPDPGRSEKDGSGQLERVTHEVVTWYYGAGNQPVGPLPASEIRALIAQGTLTRGSLLWKDGMESWTPASSLPEFAGPTVPPLVLPSPPSSGRASRIRIRRGRILAAAGAVALLCLIGGAIVAFKPLGIDSSLGASAVRGPKDEDRARGSIGLIVCGWTVTMNDGKVSDWTEGSGTGFAVTSDGYLITNKHVVESAANRVRMADQSVVSDFIANQEPFFKALTEHYQKTKNLPVTVDMVRIEYQKQIQSVEPKVWVFLGGRDALYKAKIVHVSEGHDMAILKVDRPDGAYFRISSGMESVVRGMPVFALGFPGSAMVALSEEEKTLEATTSASSVSSQMKERDFDYSVTDGIVSRVTQEQTGRQWIQHTAVITQGNSGGPLVDESGRVLAINTKGTKSGGDAAFALYSLAIPQLMKEISAHIPNLGR